MIREVEAGFSFYSLDLKSHSSPDSRVSHTSSASKLGEHGRRFNESLMVLKPQSLSSGDTETSVDSKFESETCRCTEFSLESSFESKLEASGSRFTDSSFDSKSLGEGSRCSGFSSDSKCQGTSIGYSDSTSDSKVLSETHTYSESSLDSKLCRVDSRYSDSSFDSIHGGKTLKPAVTSCNWVYYGNKSTSSHLSLGSKLEARFSHPSLSWRFHRKASTSSSAYSGSSSRSRLQGLEGSDSSLAARLEALDLTNTLTPSLSSTFQGYDGSFSSSIDTGLQEGASGYSDSSFESRLREEVLKYSSLSLNGKFEASYSGMLIRFLL
ncbi:sericin-2-like [Procambarus clarkii]|uniref:sericin-2-like n=1 Tax=Procambarus clarkii TaxID=6728 RepID=UPI003744B0CA